jgi:hypothetical protein
VAPVSREALLDGLDADLSWRRVELAALGTSLAGAKGPARDTAARSAVALAYAHWEGYVVTASRRLLTYVIGLRMKYQELSDAYLALCLGGKLAQAGVSTRSIRTHIEVVTVFRSSADRAMFPKPERAIEASGNLKSRKFEDIVVRLALNPAPFELHYNWLDAELLRRRNQIAHGQKGYVDDEFAREALVKVGDLLDRYRAATQNGAALEVYRRA